MITPRHIVLAVGLALTSGVLATPASAAPPATAAKSTATPARAGAVYLVGGELHVGDGTIIKDAVIAMDGGVFTVVGGPEARARLRDAGAAIDIAGKIVTPGLFAADTQLGLVEIDLEEGTRDDGKRTEHPIRAAHEAAAALNAESGLIPVQVIDGVTSAAVAPTGGLISGQVAVIDLVHGDHRGLAAQPRAAVAVIEARAVQPFVLARAAFAQYRDPVLRHQPAELARFHVQRGCHERAIDLDLRVERDSDALSCFHACSIRSFHRARSGAPLPHQGPATRRARCSAEEHRACALTL